MMGTVDTQHSSLTLGFSTKRSTLPVSSVTTTPYLEGSSTCSHRMEHSRWPPAPEACKPADAASSSTLAGAATKGMHSASLYASERGPCMKKKCACFLRGERGHHRGKGVRAPG